MSTHRMTTPIFSAEYWELKNPILLKGERGLAEFYDEDGHVTRIREKVGDGVMGEDRVITGTHWNDLPWIITGEKGDKGDAGPMPNHDWSGTALRFENPDGTWGDRVDLKGDPGNRVHAEPATTTTLGGVMPATGLRVDIEGYEYVALGWDKKKCYPDPIVVAYNGSPWLWLQESGVGTEAGVREPGLETSAQYWRQIANIVDIPKPGIGLKLDAKANAYDVKYGNEAGTACEGNDGRLSDARHPLAHTHVTADITDILTALPALGLTGGSTVFTISGTYTAKRSGPHFAVLVGGGGGGAGRTPAFVGGTGGAGEVRLMFVNLVQNQTYAVTVGAGGTAGPGTSDRGQNSSLPGGGNGGASVIQGFVGAAGGGGAKKPSEGGGGNAGGWFAEAGTANGREQAVPGRNITYYYGTGGEAVDRLSPRYSAATGFPGQPGIVIIFD